MDFVSVERVIELINIEEEPQGSVKPPASWPLPSGDIVFEDVTLRYAPHLDPALERVSFTIRGGSSTAIVGRTGRFNQERSFVSFANVRLQVLEKAHYRLRYLLPVSRALPIVKLSSNRTESFPSPAVFS